MIKNIIKIGLIGLGVSIAITGCTTTKANENISYKYNKDNNVEIYKVEKIAITTYISQYDFNTTVKNIRNKIKNSNGWGIKKDMNFEKMRKKGTGKRLSLGICKGSHAKKIINDDSLAHLNVLMPCGISVNEIKVNGELETHITIINTDLIRSNNKVFTEVMKEQIEIIGENVKGLH